MYLNTFQCIWPQVCPSLVALASNFCVLCTDMKVFFNELFIVGVDEHEYYYINEGKG